MFGIEVSRGEGGPFGDPECPRQWLGYCRVSAVSAGSHGGCAFLRAAKHDQFERIERSESV